LRGEDLFGKVFGGVGLRRSEPGRARTGPWSSGQGRSAAIAELTAGLDLGTTARADDAKGRPALSAESCPFTVLRLALGTPHAEPPGAGPVTVGRLRGS